MLFTYNPILVLTSVFISIVGAYACFDLVIQIHRNKSFISKKLLVAAAFAIGGSIWAMHFVAMLAVNLPVEIRYDLLTTLISGLVSVFMTAVALLIVSISPYNLAHVIVAGTIMGAGISSMHYIGMSAIRGNCGLSYSALWITISVIVGIIASIASLWLAMNLHGVWRRLVAALVMGISISGVHYIGMFGTAFLSIDRALEFSQPILSPFSLGLATAITTFIILGATLITLVPSSRLADTKKSDSDKPGPQITESDYDQLSHSSDPHLAKLPVQKNQKTYFIDLVDIVSVTADGHYTKICTTTGEDHFCNHSLSRVEKDFDGNVFFRVHRSHIVNLHHVKSFKRVHDKGLIYMNNEDSAIPVSRTNIEKLQEILGI